MFSFRGRTPRLSYFLGFLGVTGACFIPVILVLALLSPIRAGNHIALVLLIVLLVACVIVLFWVSLALQTRRIRDIGWDPLIVLPAWFAVEIADSIAAHFYQNLAIGPQHNGTAFGVIVEIGMIAVLFFWPSAYDDGDGASLSFASRSLPKSPDPAPTLPMPVPRPAGAAARPTFGRR